MRTKKIIVSFFLLLAIVQTSVTRTYSFPDEGMFPPDKIAGLPLMAKGLKIKPTDIYNPKGGGLSEAIIRLSIGCSAEFVSPDGLILTNHHCGFEALVAASSVGKDYGNDGYKAASRKDELPAQDYSIQIPTRTEDVTARVLKGTESISGQAKDDAIKANIAEIEKQENAKTAGGRTVRVQTVSDGYFYYLYETMEIKDIRVVYAPPRDIGFFGGDPDNFEWSRHTGDFTFLRAYVGPDGKPADYSPNNVPYKPKKFLTVSLNGLKENDFVFVMGYPGGTTRYRESQSVNYYEHTNWPFLVDFYMSWAHALEMIGETDEAKKIKLQDTISNLMNSQKAYMGAIPAVQRGGVVAQKQAEELKFQTWANTNPARKAKYGTLLSDIANVSKPVYTTPNRDRLIRTLPGPGSMPVYKQIFDAINAVSRGQALTDAKRKEIEAAINNREPIQEVEMLKFLFRKFRELPAGEKFAPADTLFGNKQGKERIEAEEGLATSIGVSKEFDSVEKIAAIYKMKIEDIKKKAPNLIDFVLAHGTEQASVLAKTAKFNAEITNLRVLYMQGISEMKGIKPYPDANFTQRFTYGHVKGYKPREAVSYSPFTTLKGVIEKDTGIFPFIVDKKLKDLQRSKDFGRFGVGDSVPVNFLSTVDIIGGNSGSPILNGWGEQVGIIFDGNYEGLGNDMFFDPNYNRSISVDIRYVLFLTEKYAGLGWIVNEMKLKGGRAMAAGR